MRTDANVAKPSILTAMRRGNHSRQTTGQEELQMLLRDHRRCRAKGTGVRRNYDAEKNALKILKKPLKKY